MHHWVTNHAVVFRGTVGQVNHLLSVKLGQYRLSNATYFSNDKAPTVTSAIAPKIADILGLNSLQRFHPATPAQHGLLVPTDKPHVSAGAFLASETLHVEGDAQAAHTRSAALSPQILGGFPGIIPLDIWNEQAYNYDGLAKFSHCCNPADAEFAAQWDWDTLPACEAGLALLKRFAELHPEEWPFVRPAISPVRQSALRHGPGVVSGGAPLGHAPGVPGLIIHICLMFACALTCEGRPQCSTFFQPLFASELLRGIGKDQLCLGLAPQRSTCA